MLGIGLLALGLAINLLSLSFGLGRLWRTARPTTHRPLVTTLVLPLAGRADSLGRLVAALERQTLTPRRLIVGVESRSDPAYHRALAVAATTSLPIEVVVAGLATVQGQKCRNQQAALERLDDRDEAVVLLDGDIAPTDWWLSALVSPLADDTADIVTGLRWQQVVETRLGAHLVTMIDRSAFLMPRVKWRIARVVWGGSVAISRRAVEKMNLHEALGRTLSDDLSIAEAAKASGLRMLTRSALLIPTPSDLGPAAAWRFAVRQYRIVHIYRPFLWWMAAAVILLRLAAWTAILAGLQRPGFGLAAIAMAALAALKPVVVSAIGRRIGLADRPAALALQVLLGFVQPLVDLFHASVILAAAWTRRIRWGHVLYRIDAPYDVTVEARVGA